MTDEQKTEEPAADTGSVTVADGGGTPEVPTEQVVEDGGPLSEAQSAEFHSPWHRDAYIASIKRDIDGALVKGDEEQLANAERELERVTAGAHQAAQKRPRGRGKQTR